jgi:hypothetical protein
LLLLLAGCGASEVPTSPRDVYVLQAVRPKPAPDAVSVQGVNVLNSSLVQGSAPGAGAPSQLLPGAGALGPLLRTSTCEITNGSDLKLLFGPLLRDVNANDDEVVKLTEDERDLIYKCLESPTATCSIPRKKLTDCLIATDTGGNPNVGTLTDKVYGLWVWLHWSDER